MEFFPSPIPLQALIVRDGQSPSEKKIYIQVNCPHRIQSRYNSDKVSRYFFFFFVVQTQVQVCVLYYLWFTSNLGK